MLRWGILGTGHAAGALYAPAMRAAGHDLAVVGSRSLTRAQAFAANHGVRRARGDYGEVLAAEDVDAVLVALPNALHEEWGVGALEAGKHVLCPAPLTVDAAGAGRMAAAAGAHRRVLMEGLPAWFHPRTQALLELVRAGGLGDLRLVEAVVARRLRDPHSYRARPELGGGALLDLGVPAVALLRWLAAAEPDGVRTLQRRWATGIDGTVSALLSFPGGVSGALQLSFDAHRHEVLEVVGTQGAVRVPLPFAAGAADDAELWRDGSVTGTWRADPVERMVASFADAIRHGKEAPLAVDDAVATAQVLDRIRAEAI